MAYTMVFNEGTNNHINRVFKALRKAYPADMKYMLVGFDTARSVGFFRPYGIFYDFDAPRTRDEQNPPNPDQLREFLRGVSWGMRRRRCR